MSNNETNLLLLSLKTSSSLEIPCNPTLEYLPHQKAGVEYILLSKNTLIGDDQGIGKTITAIAALNKLESESVLIVVPASLQLNWERELRKWLVKDLSVEILNSKNVKSIWYPNIIICSYNALLNMDIMQVLASRTYDVMIMDEVHFIKNKTAKRTKAVQYLAQKAGKILGLSGTPMVNRPMELYNAIDLLCPRAIGYMSEFDFGLRYCSGYHNGHGWDFTGASNLKELGINLRKRMMIRRRKKDVLKDLPDKFIDVVYLEDDPKVLKVDKKVEMDKAKLSSPEIKLENLGELASWRKELGELKAGNAVKYIRNQLEAGHKKVVMFAHHKNTVKELFEGLKEYGPVKIVGGTSIPERQKSVDAFQEDPKVRVFIGSITAAGVGLTLTAASYVVFVEASWVAGENFQAMDRCHRIGQKDNVLVEFLTFKDSLDEIILRSHLVKEKRIKKLMGE